MFKNYDGLIPQGYVGSLTSRSDFYHHFSYHRHLHSLSSSSVSSLLFIFKFLLQKRHDFLEFENSTFGLEPDIDLGLNQYLETNQCQPTSFSPLITKFCPFSVFLNLSLFFCT